MVPARNNANLSSVNHTTITIHHHYHHYHHHVNTYSTKKKTLWHRSEFLLVQIKDMRTTSLCCFCFCIFYHEKNVIHLLLLFVHSEDVVAFRSTKSFHHCVTMYLQANTIISSSPYNIVLYYDLLLGLN